MKWGNHMASVALVAFLVVAAAVQTWRGSLEASDSVEELVHRTEA